MSKAPSATLLDRKLAQSQAPPPPTRPTFSFQEIQNTLTKLTLALDKKDDLIAEYDTKLTAATHRVSVLEAVLDKFLQSSWREGKFEFLPDILEPSDEPEKTAAPSGSE